MEGIPHRFFFLLNDKAVAILSGLLFERNSGSVEKEVVEDLSELSLESSNYLIPGEDTKHDTQSIEVLEAKVYSNDFGTTQTSENSQELTGAKVSLLFTSICMFAHVCMHVKTFRILNFCKIVLLVICE